MKEIIGLAKLLFSEKKRLFLSFFFMIFVAFFTYIFVDMIQPIMDEMFFQGVSAPDIPEKKRFIDAVFSMLNITKEQIAERLPVILVIVIFGKGFFTFLSSFFMRSIGLKVVMRLRNDLFGSFVYQSADFFDKYPTGKLMQRLTSDVDKIQEALSGSMGDFIRELFILIALLTSLFLKDWKLAMASFIIAPLGVIPLVLFSMQLKKRGLRNQMRMADIYNLLHETITGNRIVKAFSMEKFEIGKFFHSTLNYFKTSLKLALVGCMSSPFMEFMGGVLGAFILFVGTTRIAQGHLSPGDFGSFMVAIFLIYTPIKRLSRANNIIQQGVAGYERVMEVLSEKPRITDSPGARPLDGVKGEIRFDGVWFGYDPDRPVLKEVSFEVRPTEKAALVGLSGAGKTTIINLVCRFYDPDRGRVLLDGIDIRDVTLDSLRSKIGLVTQELILFNDTVRNNIAYGMTDISLEKVAEAARAAKAHEFIMDLPREYDTIIGEKGCFLSSGQRQRLSIARALIKNPPVLILDEATSALDSESERLIQSALSYIMKNRTTIVIAHRLSTIRRADKIFVVDQGRITQTGRHKELLDKGGLYKKLYELQFPKKGDMIE